MNPARFGEPNGGRVTLLRARPVAGGESLPVGDELRLDTRGLFDCLALGVRMQGDADQHPWIDRDEALRDPLHQVPAATTLRDAHDQSTAVLRSLLHSLLRSFGVTSQSSP